MGTVRNVIGWGNVILHNLYPEKSEMPVVENIPSPLSPTIKKYQLSFHEIQRPVFDEHTGLYSRLLDHRRL